MAELHHYPLCIKYQKDSYPYDSHTFRPIACKQIKWVGTNTTPRISSSSKGKYSPPSRRFPDNSDTRVPLHGRLRKKKKEFIKICLCKSRNINHHRQLSSSIAAGGYQANTGMKSPGRVISQNARILLWRPGFGWAGAIISRFVILLSLNSFAQQQTDSPSVLAVVEHHRHHRVESRSLNECFSFYLLHSIPSREEFHANQYSISYTVSRYFTRWDWIPGP